MLQRFVQVLQTDDQDDTQAHSADVLRRFWTHAPNRPGLPLPAAGRVVDLSQWASRRRVER
jgi:hypothetical protein